jgi:hypothetical protein
VPPQEHTIDNAKSNGRSEMLLYFSYFQVQEFDHYHGRNATISTGC